MDSIFEGLMKSSKSEKEKQEVVRRMVAAAGQQKTTKETVDMLKAASRILLSGSSGFQWDSAKDIYRAWGSNNKIALRQYFTTDTMYYLMDENFPNNFNAVWIMHHSISELRDVSGAYGQYCEVLQLKATTYIRTHSAFNTVVPFCKMLREFREGIPRSVVTPLFCNTIIDVVSVYTLPADCQPFDYLSNMSNVIGDLLGHIWQKCDEETMWLSLKHVFELIKLPTSEGKSPSVALAAIVQYFPTNRIPKALHSLLQDSSVQPNHVRLALDRMMQWLQWPGAKNIHLWVNGFLNELANAKKYSLLIEVTESSIEKVRGPSLLSFKSFMAVNF